MPVARFEMPDGRIARFEVPEGTTPEQAQQLIQAEIGRQAPAQPQDSQPEDSFLDDALDVAGEFAAGANRFIADGIDIVPNGINAGLRLAGVDAQLPTVRGLMQPTGIEGGFMEPGIARDVVQGAGAIPGAAAGLTQVPRNLSKIGGAAMEFMGVGTAAPSASIASRIPFTTDRAVARETPNKLALLRNDGNADTAGLMLDQAGNVVKDKAGRSAMWQGLEPKVTAFIRSASDDTKKKMSDMLHIVERRNKNYRYGLSNRPLDVVGDSVLNRIKVVREANRDAGRRLDGVANDLMGAHVDVAPAVDEFLATLSEMGMKYNPDTKELTLVQGSTTQDMPKVHKEAARILKRLQTTRKEGVIDGYDVHVMKKWIDNNVDYAKNSKGKSGMIGELERAVKGLRHNLDSALDAEFPEYNRVNTKYSETRGALDNVFDIAGKRFNPDANSASLSLGSLSRRFLSNAQSNGYLQDAVENLDSIARKYISPGTDVGPYRSGSIVSGVTPEMLENDDLIGLVGYSDQLDKMFGAAADTSLYGDVSKAADRAVDSALGQMTATGMLAEGAKWAGRKAMGKNEENAMKAMRELLRGVE